MDSFEDVSPIKNGDIPASYVYQRVVNLTLDFATYFSSKAGGQKGCPVTDFFLGDLRQHSFPHCFWSEGSKGRTGAGFVSIICANYPKLAETQ